MLPETMTLLLGKVTRPDYSRFAVKGLVSMD